jgi:GT2 family glycosyltransferase
MTRLAIIIVSHNARADLAGTLASLTDAPPATSHEIVVVDNRSTDGAPSLVRDRFPGVRLIEAGANLGFAKANNLGIRSTESDLVLLLNPDTLVPTGAIDNLVRRQEQTTAEVIGPRLVDAEGRAELSFGRALSPLREMGRKATLALDARGVPQARTFIERATRRERDVDWVTGACLLVRRSAAVAAGLLDERYFLYVEDVDFCLAVRALGGRVVFSPVAEIVHLRGRSGLSSAGAARQAWHQSHLAYYRKHLPGLAPWLGRYLRWRGLVVV